MLRAFGLIAIAAFSRGSFSIGSAPRALMKRCPEAASVVTAPKEWPARPIFARFTAWNGASPADLRRSTSSNAKRTSPTLAARLPGVIAPFIARDTPAILPFSGIHTPSSLPLCWRCTLTMPWLAQCSPHIAPPSRVPPSPCENSTSGASPARPFGA